MDPFKFVLNLIIKLRKAQKKKEICLKTLEAPKTVNFSLLTHSHSSLEGKSFRFSNNCHLDNIQISDSSVRKAENTWFWKACYGQ